jgi:S-DNA-T family DNA segregation ATPase FtsK/SpoIIIE
MKKLAEYLDVFRIGKKAMEATDRIVKEMDSRKKIAEKLIEVLAGFGINGKIDDIIPGPIVTRYEIELVDNSKVIEVMALAVNIRRVMEMEQIRISVIPKTQLIGIELANRDREIINFEPLIKNPDFAKSQMTLPLALGVETDGKPFYADLTKMPHLLIAGRTGSGKSILLQAIIMSLVNKFSSEQLKLTIN